MHTHTHIHTHTQTHKCRNTHRYIYTCTQTHTQIDKHTDTYSCTHTALLAILREQAPRVNAESVSHIHRHTHTHSHTRRYTHRLYTHRHIHTYIHTDVWAILMNLSGHSHYHWAGLEKLLHVSLTLRSTSPSEKPVSAICAAVEKTVSTARTKEENIQ